MQILQQCALSATGPLHVPTAPGQFLDQPIPVISLDFDPAIDHGSARAAALFQFGRQLRESFCGQSNAADDGNALAFAALRFTADPHDAIRRGLSGRAFLADTVGDGALAIATTFTDPGGIDDTAAIGRA